LTSFLDTSLLRAFFASGWEISAAEAGAESGFEQIEEGKFVFFIWKISWVSEAETFEMDTINQEFLDFRIWSETWCEFVCFLYGSLEVKRYRSFHRYLES
jgi:hypothetical protein